METKGIVRQLPLLPLQGMLVTHADAMVARLGISTAEFAILAYEADMQGIVLLNHDGLKLDTVHLGVEVLIEIVAVLRIARLPPEPEL